MALTTDDLKKLVPVYQDTFDGYYNFQGSEILKTKTGLTFTRLDNHSLRPGGFNRLILIYKKGDKLYAYFPDDGIYSQVKQESFIISRSKGFDGFDRGKIFELENGMKWEQTDNLKSNCSPGEMAIIWDNRTLKISNWDFYVEVKRIV
jgi:hypothetical protein